MVGLNHAKWGGKQGSTTVLPIKKQNMKNLYKAALLAALGLAGVTAAQAQSDMLLGFNDAGANSGAAGYQNDYVIDLGAISGFTATSTFSGSINQTTFDNAFSSDGSYLNDVAVGVVAENNGVSPKQLYVSATSTPNHIATTQLNNSIASASAITVGSYTTASGISSQLGWSYAVGVAPGTPNTFNGNATGNGNEIMGAVPGVETSLSSGDAAFNLYEATSSGSTHSFTEIGTFTVDANNGVDTISYEGVDAAVPEPATYGIFGGMGVLLLGLRRQLTGKLA